MKAPRKTSAPSTPEEQHPVLVLPGYGEVARDDGPHEDVVDRRGLLDQVAGEVLLSQVGAVLPPDEATEADAAQDPHDGPGSGLTDTDHVGERGLLPSAAEWTKNLVDCQAELAVYRLLTVGSRSRIMEFEGSTPFTTTSSSRSAVSDPVRRPLDPERWGRPPIAWQALGTRRCGMDDSLWTLWTWWTSALFGDVGDVIALVVVVGVLGLRVLPSTRRWAPRGNARPARPGSGTRVSGIGSPQQVERGSSRGPGVYLSQRALSPCPTPALRR